MDMSRFIPKSSFYEMYKEFYIIQYDILDKRVTSMLEHMFSNIKIRLYSARQFNPPLFKHVTLNLDGHDTRVAYPNVDRASLYSYKLKKSGFRTQVCTDINNMVLFVSKSAPCRDFNDGTMFVQMKMETKIHELDCIALDGAYNLFINQVVEANDSISVRNFCCPIRKLRGIDLSDVE